MARYHSRTAYQKYLMSRRWLEHPARLAEFEAAGDLTALSSDCHRAVTDFLRRRRYDSRRIKTLNFQGALEGSFELIDPIARKVCK